MVTPQSAWAKQIVNNPRHPRHWTLEATDDLAGKGWYHGVSIIPVNIIGLINKWMDLKVASGAFSIAGVGKNRFHQNNDSIRRVINRELFAGLESFEGHLSIYQAGGFYKKHVDTFREDDARKITFILYLNEHWTAGHGGYLRLDTSVGESSDISPVAGSVVMFNSRDFAHEVLAGTAERRSFTGWFKVRSNNP